MREILFKAKRTDNCEWVEGFYFEHAGNHFIIDLSNTHIHATYLKEDIFDFDLRAFIVDPNTLCQYTGLTDKNGNKIWENDVVYARCNGLSGKGVVQYEKGCFVLKDNKRNRTYSLFGEWTFRVDGNSIDNPELLKEE